MAICLKVRALLDWTHILNLCFFFYMYECTGSQINMKSKMLDMDSERKRQASVTVYIYVCWGRWGEEGSSAGDN